MDLVYTVKFSEINYDLLYSLRSVEKYCTFDNIWIVGYKPVWVKNVQYIRTNQSKSKYNNTTFNIIQACMNDKISDDFILMNDDFIAISPITDWKKQLNVCLGYLDKRAEWFRLNSLPSKWRNGFQESYDLLQLLNCPNTYDFEIHAPMIINKKKFLNMLENPIIKEFRQKHDVFFKRSIYGNLYFRDNYKNPKMIKDVKIYKDNDLSKDWMTWDWISVFDNVIRNPLYPVLNNFLKTEFPRASKFDRY